MKRPTLLRRLVAFRLPGEAYLSVGSTLIVLVAIVSTGVVSLWPVPHQKGIELWTFATEHLGVYGPTIRQWNQWVHDHPDSGLLPVHMRIISMNALSRRTLASFWSNAPVADLIEVERSQIGNYVRGPIKDVGFIDLTGRLHHDGLYEAINQPSFSPWTSRGHIFGIPHDVHPVMLWYRADLVRKAGIDISRIKTWDQFVRQMKPLVKDLDGDGIPDRYILNIWPNDTAEINVLLLQAGGGTFSPDGKLIIECKANARVLANIVSWCDGPNRIAIDAPEFSAAGNQLRIQGRVIAGLMPDWLAGYYEQHLPQLAGKVKLMPLPAWDTGGRRTSVRGGSMLGITRQTKHLKTAWAFAQKLYTSPDTAKRLFQTADIVSPIRKLWSKSFYDQPKPYFSNQPIGRMYIKLAPYVPLRTSSPFRTLALARITDACLALARYAQNHHIYKPDALIPQARILLAQQQKRVEQEIHHDLFLKAAAK